MPTWSHCHTHRPDGGAVESRTLNMVKVALKRVKLLGRVRKLKFEKSGQSSRCLRVRDSSLRVRFPLGSAYHARPKHFGFPLDLQPSESEIVDAVFQSEKRIRREPLENCK